MSPPLDVQLHPSGTITYREPVAHEDRMPIFDPASLHAAIAEQLKTADLGTAQNAFVAVVTRDAAGEVVVRGAVTQKVGEHWRVSAVVAIDHQAKIEGGLEVKAAW